MSTNRLDIFAAMDLIDRRDFNWFSKQPEELRKTVGPPVLLRIVSSVTDNRADDLLITVNERLNKHFWTLNRFDFDLLYRLAASTGSGRTRRHSWIAMVPSKRQQAQAFDFMAEMNPMLKLEDVDRLLRLHTPESLTNYLYDCGCQDNDVSNIISSFRVSYGHPDTTPKPKTRRKASRSKDA